MRKSLMTEKLWESAEFQARQLAFDFGRVARVVIPIIKNMKAKMNEWIKHLSVKTSRKFIQLDLFICETKEYTKANCSQGI